MMGDAVQEEDAAAEVFGEAVAPGSGSSRLVSRLTSYRIPIGYENVKARTDSS